MHARRPGRTNVISLAEVRRRRESLDASPNWRWDRWYDSLGRDADFAAGWAMAYAQMTPEARTALLDIIELDRNRRPELSACAVYMPLLLVETDENLQNRLRKLVGTDCSKQLGAQRWALAGETSKAERVLCFVEPTYLQFVRVTSCRFHPGRSFSSIEHDEWVSFSRAPRAGHVVFGARLREVAFDEALMEVSATVVAHRRTADTGVSLERLATLFAAPIFPYSTQR